MSPRPKLPRHLSQEDFQAQLAQVEGVALLIAKLPDLTKLIAEIRHVERVGPRLAPTDFASGAKALEAARDLALTIQTLRGATRGHLWRLLREQVKNNNTSAIAKMADFADEPGAGKTNGGGAERDR